jgi:hypothetical protein
MPSRLRAGWQKSDQGIGGHRGPPAYASVVVHGCAPRSSLPATCSTGCSTWHARPMSAFREEPGKGAHSNLACLHAPRCPRRSIRDADAVWSRMLGATTNDSGAALMQLFAALCSGARRQENGVLPWFLDLQAARADSGRARSSIRLRTVTAIRVSVSCAGRLWERKVSPMIRLYRLIVPSAPALAL